MIKLPVMRRCTKCAVRMPRDLFHYSMAGRVRKDGRQTLRKYCRRCASLDAGRRDKAMRADPAVATEYRRRRAALIRKYTAENPERKREYQRRWDAKVRADPVLRERRRANDRANYQRHKAFRRGWSDEPAYVPVGGGTSDLLPVGPLVAFVRDVYPNADVMDLGRLLLLDGSQARRIFNGEHTRASMSVIDRALTCGLGRPDLFDVLYPPEET